MISDMSFATNEVLFELFKDENCTQIEFAHRVESDKNSIHDWFKGKNQLRYDKLEFMASRLGKKIKIVIE
jgi:transcriptional regulator with XRE-family HTH domain